MKYIKNIIKWILYVLLLPLSYLFISLILTLITVNKSQQNETPTIYLSSNGVHLSVVLPINHIDSAVLNGLTYNYIDQYLSFGWGEENFYINTPNWSDLTFSNALKALFTKSSTLIHVTRYPIRQTDWVEVQLSDSSLEKLNTYLLHSFQKDTQGLKTKLLNQGYTKQDDFYKATGHYTIFNTCNTWINTGFKESGLKACLWTPFDFGLMYKYRTEK